MPARFAFRAGRCAGSRAPTLTQVRAFNFTWLVGLSSFGLHLTPVAKTLPLDDIRALRDCLRALEGTATSRLAEHPRS